MERKMNRIKSLIAISAFSLIVLGLPAIASAQWGGNGGYNPNGGYGNGRYNRDIRGTVENLRNGARNFENIVDHGNRGYGNRNYGRYNDRNLRLLADQFTDATKDLRNSYGRGRDLNGSANDARRVLDVAAQIDRELSYTNGGDGYGNNGLQNEWYRMDNDLRILADTYGYSNRGWQNNRNTRNSRNGNWRNRVPFPLPF
jgi:hypothetical protein